MTGNMGSKSRLAYTGIGDTANLASRIENLNRFNGTRLMVAEETRNLAGNEFEWRHVDGVRVKGKAVAVKLFEPLGPKGSVHQDKLAFRDQFKAALYAYRDGNFQDAFRIFSEMKSIEREELSVVRLQHLSTESLRTLPPDSWDRITDYDVK
jgi:adenylate cyclase